MAGQVECKCERASHIKMDPSLQVCYILTGHGSLNSFLFSRNVKDSPDGVCGYESEDWAHVLFDCEMYEAFRNLHELNIVRRDDEWDVSAVLEDRVAYKRFCMFVERAYSMWASIIARAAVDEDDVIEQYENMITVMHAE